MAGRLGNRFPPARQPVAKLPTLQPGAVTTQLHKMEGSRVWGTLQIPSRVETFLSVQVSAQSGIRELVLSLRLGFPVY